MGGRPDTWSAQWWPGGDRWTARDKQDPGTAWCSWYGLRRRFDYESLDAAMDVIEREHLPISTVQVDDGFAGVLGDWRSSVRPDLGSLEQLAARINDRGFRAGLWLCPTLADVTSEAVARFPELWVPGVDMPFGGARLFRTTRLRALSAQSTKSRFSSGVALPQGTSTAIKNRHHFRRS